MKEKRVLLRIVTAAIFVSCSASVGWAGLINVAWDGSQYTTELMRAENFTNLTPDLINIKAFMGTNAEGGVDWLFYDNNAKGWTNYRNISGNLAQYNDVTSARGSGVNMLAARDGKLENIYWYGTWFDVWEVSNNTYTSLATDLVAMNNYYGTRSDGLVNVHYYNGWHEDVMNTNVYTEVSPFAQSKVYAIGDGRLDTVYYGNGWEYDNINTNTYSSVAANVGTSLQGDMLAARDGSLDWIYDNGSGWETVSISTDTFVDIIWNGTDLFYGAKASGGLYEIAYDGSDWSLTLINSQSYSVLSTTEIEDSKEIYANAQAILGDANRDGIVSAGDYACVQSKLGNVGTPGILGDANLDGIVSEADYASVQANFGSTSPSTGIVPEPTTMSLMVISFGALLRRKLK